MLKLQKVIWNGKKKQKEKETTHKSLKREEANMAASAISNLLRKNVGAGLARVSLNKNIIRNYFSLVFSVDKRAFKRRVWFDFNLRTIKHCEAYL